MMCTCCIVIMTQANENREALERGMQNSNTNLVGQQHSVRPWAFSPSPGLGRLLGESDGPTPTVTVYLHGECSVVPVVQCMYIACSVLCTENQRFEGPDLDSGC